MLLKRRETKYTVTCKCENRMRVRRKHFGRMCRCTRCGHPIYVTYENVSPPMEPYDKGALRIFSEEEMPLDWEKGDLLMETYEVLGVAGKGGMGVVYKVYHRGWGMPIAVKCPRARIFSQLDKVEAFERECETWVNLAPSPHIVGCHYVRRLGGVPRVFVEYVNGHSLAELLASRALYEGTVQDVIERIIDIAIQFAWGLGHAHDSGVIHQDVKPNNVLVGKDGLVRVTDFGLARVYADDASGRGQGVAGGATPGYRSPDGVLPSHLQFKSDIWSWALSVLEMFTVEPNWKDGKKARNALERFLKEPPTFRQAPVIPIAIADLLFRCFEDDPEVRPDHMREVAGALKSIYQAHFGRPYHRNEPSGTAPSAHILNNRAVSYIDLDKHQEAIALWARILDAEPNHIEATYNLHLLSWRAGHITDREMVSLLEELEGAHPADWRPAYFRARVLMETGNARGAQRALAALSEADRERREAAYASAMILSIAKRDKRPIWRIRPPRPASAVAMAGHGARVLTGDDEGVVCVWENASRQGVATLSGHHARIGALCLDESARLAVTASDDGHLQSWNATTGVRFHALAGEGQPFGAVAVSRNGALVFAGGDDGRIHVWHATSGEQDQIWTGHEGAITSLVVSKCGNYVLSGATDCAVRLWEVRSGRCLGMLGAHRSPAIGLGVSADLTQAVTCAGRKIKTWDLATGETIRVIRAHKTPITGFAVTEDARYALTSTDPVTVKLWDLQLGQCLRSFRASAPIAMSADGRFAAMADKAGRQMIWALHCNDLPFRAPYQICHDADVEGDAYAG